eukprot:gnl/MRDRNA2_/MRDRNA2_27481_c0_seq1.p1 gnl/MRDRNA2_/MRDRNA2_27481_c0~~gnl/MRDRNA2_/MRDRNA2_27481_c0_seq1.p1  ORF type:complete len:561 (-),score=59.88 gnl/MRDRNA2_/MRDRNA2_27481_c0_seq1:13-1695(-)
MVHVQQMLGWKEELIAKLQDGLDKLYRSANHGLPDIESSEELRVPVGVERINMLQKKPDLQTQDRDHSKKIIKQFRVPPNNDRHPCYVGVSISKINDIRSAGAFFDLRVRLSLLFELDLIGAGFEKWVDAAHESQAGFLPLLATHIESLRDLGIVIPKMVFLNAISQKDVRPVEIRMYPREQESQLECITWSHMWDVQFRQHFDLRDFPFDRQDLLLELAMIDLEPARLMDRFHLVVYAVQYKQEVMNLPEWQVHTPRIQRRFPLHRRMNIHIRVSRQPQYYFWNILFVVFMISTLGFTVFMESWNNTSERVSIVLTLLLTNITFQYNVSSQLPKLCYFTLLDRYTFAMTLSLFLLCFGCCAAKLQQYLIYWFDSLDFLDEWDAESVDHIVSFTFGIWYLLVHMQWIWLVLRHWFLFSYDSISDSHFMGTSKNAPSWLCFMFSHPFFIGAPKDDQPQSLEDRRSNLAKYFAKSPSVVPKRIQTEGALDLSPPQTLQKFPKTPCATPQNGTPINVAKDREKVSAASVRRRNCATKRGMKTSLQAFVDDCETIDPLDPKAGA